MEHEEAIHCKADVDQSALHCTLSVHFVARLLTCIVHVLHNHDKGDDQKVECGQERNERLPAQQRLRSSLQVPSTPPKLSCSAEIQLKRVK